MGYKMEELVPIVAKLSEKYTHHESSSITYEKAQELMEAVLYCIAEAEKSGGEAALMEQDVPAEKAYEIGLTYVEEKVKRALALYNELSQDFCFYDNRCLYETFAKGIPEFFKWYDVKFAPQNTILTLDYPVLKNLSGETGIDRIYEYIKCLRLEQTFLRKFPEAYVMETLDRCLVRFAGKYRVNHREMIENICELVWTSMVPHILLGRPLNDMEISVEEEKKIIEICRQEDAGAKLEMVMNQFLENYYEDGRELGEYFSGLADTILTRLKYLNIIE